MTQSVFIIGVFLLSGLYFRLVTNQRFVVCSLYLPLVITLVTTIFGKLNLTIFGFFVAFIVVIIVFILLVVFIIKDKVSLKSILSVFDSSFYAFIFMVAIVFVCCMNNKVVDGDELLTWGAIPKMIHIRIASGIDNARIIRNYVYNDSSIAYFLSFCTILKTTFSENMLYFGYSVLSMSILLAILFSVFKKISINNILQLLVLIILGRGLFSLGGIVNFQLTVSLDYNYFKGLFFGAILVISQFELNKFNKPLIWLMLMCLCLVDISGCIIGVGTCIFIYFGNHSNNNSLEDKSFSVGLLLCNITIFIHTLYKTNFDAIGVQRFFDELFSYLFCIPIISNGLPILIMFIIVLLLIISFYRTSSNGNNHKTILITQGIIFLLYCYVTFTIFNSFGGSIKVTLIARSICAYVWGVILGSTPYIATTNEIVNFKKPNYIFQIRNVCILIILVSTTLFSSQNVIKRIILAKDSYSNEVFSTDYLYEDFQFLTSYHLERISYFLEDYDTNPKKVFFSGGGCDYLTQYVHALVSYELLDRNVYIVNRPLTLSCMDLEQFDYELQRADYIYMMYPISDSLNCQISERYSNTDLLLMESVYKITRYDSELQFEIISK